MTVATRSAQRLTAPRAVACSYLQSNSSASGLTTYTFTAENLGTADSGRFIIAAIGGRHAGAAHTLSSVTIGGVTATIATQANVTTTNGNTVALVIAAVPTGTTGDVVVTFSAAMLRCGIALYRATNLNPTAFQTQPVTAGTANPTANLDIPAGGLAIATSLNSNNPSTTTWTGLTIDFDFLVGGNASTDFSGAHDLFSAFQSARTITATQTSAVQPVATMASWAPA